MNAAIGESYNERILKSIIDNTPYVNDNPYPSRIELLLMELKEAIEAGGGSGVVVDQTYSETSANAQSGTAVAQALETIPTQVNADWDATEGAAVILHKPTIPAAQVNSDWNAVSGAAEILNKPTLGAAAACGVDTAPASGSTNLITSGAVYAVVGDINAVLEEVL